MARTCSLNVDLVEWEPSRQADGFDEDPCVTSLERVAACKGVDSDSRRSALAALAMLNTPESLAAFRQALENLTGASTTWPRPRLAAGVRHLVGDEDSLSDLADWERTFTEADRWLLQAQTATELRQAAASSRLRRSDGPDVLVFPDGVLGCANDLWFILEKGPFDCSGPWLAGVTLWGPVHGQRLSCDVRDGVLSVDVTCLGRSESYTLDLDSLLLDTDGDGLTDVMEQRLGLDWRRADTDGDGRSDGADPSPSALPEAGVEEVLMELAVLEQFLAFEERRHPVVLFVENAAGAVLETRLGPSVYCRSESVVPNCYGSHSSLVVGLEFTRPPALLSHQLTPGTLVERSFELMLRDGPSGSQVWEGIVVRSGGEWRVTKWVVMR